MYRAIVTYSFCICMVLLAACNKEQQGSQPNPGNPGGGEGDKKKGEGATIGPSNVIPATKDGPQLKIHLAGVTAFNPWSNSASSKLTPVSDPGKVQALIKLLGPEQTLKKLTTKICGFKVAFYAVDKKKRKIAVIGVCNFENNTVTKAKTKKTWHEAPAKFHLLSSNTEWNITIPDVRALMEFLDKNMK